MQRGFTLIELMIVIAIIAILSAISVPAYQGYLRKAAFTDMLQLMQPYKATVELCVVDRGSLKGCNNDQSGIPSVGKSRYVSTLHVNDGKISMQGTESLTGLLAELHPEYDSKTGYLIWHKRCTSDNSNLLSICRAQLAYDDAK